MPDFDPAKWLERVEKMLRAAQKTTLPHTEDFLAEMPDDTAHEAHQEFRRFADQVTDWLVDLDLARLNAAEKTPS